MTISVSPFAEPWSIPDRTRPTFTINQTVTASTDDALNETITNVTATVDGTEPNLVITPGTTSVSITGSFADPFSDSFTYVDAGESTNTMTPITVTGADNLPADKVFYDLDQDMTAYTTKTFTVVVSYELNNAAQTPESFTLTMKINNEWEGIRSLVDNYYD
tara:strand:- start:142 stop:627 length:486 start_codon:yes stop_codon:yes gene_type:complete